MEHRWNETDRGKPKYSRKNLSQYHFVHHIPHGLTQDRTRAPENFCVIGLVNSSVRYTPVITVVLIVEER
jgi:hypothetical protein